MIFFLEKSDNQLLAHFQFFICYLESYLLQKIVVNNNKNRQIDDRYSRKFWLYSILLPPHAIQVRINHRTIGLLHEICTLYINAMLLLSSLFGIFAVKNINDNLE